MNAILNISPIDGRYQSKTKSLSNFFSEHGLIKYRVKVEIEYLLALNKVSSLHLNFTDHQIESIQSILTHFDTNDSGRIKEIEKTTNHDVKAVEYFLKEKLMDILPENTLEYIHFGLTSQDINNTAVPLSIKDCLNEHIIPELSKIQQEINRFADEWLQVPLLARTHGQPASPTTLGKEMRVFSERLHKQIEKLESIQVEAKFGGATGNMNAHKIAFPEIDWRAFARDFLQSLGLKRQETTTQIEHYDGMAEIFDNLSRIATILIDYCRDIWTYVSLEYFKQKLKKGEIGSSAMPHKVNPIDFENAEGNLGIAIAIWKHLSQKLPISRLQRDLTDSTVLRNIGVPFGHLMISINSITKGNGKLLLNESALNRDLENNWMVVAEAIQSVLRTIGYEKPYEALKELTRTNESIGKDEIHLFINNLNINDEIKARLLKISPQNYIGYASDM